MMSISESPIIAALLAPYLFVTVELSFAQCQAHAVFYDRKKTDCRVLRNQVQCPASNFQKPPEAPRKHPSTKPPAPPVPKVKSPAREAAPKPANQEAPVPTAVPVRPPRLPSPPKEDPKPAEEPAREAVAVRSPEVGTHRVVLNACKGRGERGGITK